MALGVISEHHDSSEQAGGLDRQDRQDREAVDPGTENERTHWLRGGGDQTGSSAAKARGNAAATTPLKIAQLTGPR
jgi:hypothetical protein